MIRKLILTNRAALTKKYGAEGWSAIRKALMRLAAADLVRGVTTSLELLDASSKAGVPKVTSPGSAKQAKAAVDALYRKHGSPDYVMLLGGTDVVPYQVLSNPLASDDPDGDPDPNLPSDLPYASEAPYSKKVEDFIGVTRVVSRLPDVRGATRAEVKGLIGLIDAATTFTGTPGKSAFVISADEWKGATRANVKLAFGAKAKTKIQRVPPRGPTSWKPKQIQSPLHFINCHGALTDPNYYGSSPEFPEAHLPSSLSGLVASGAIVVAECCFGAELYNPNSKVALGLANTYLLQGAAAYVGSTNTAYGEATAADRCAADILCTDFMAAVLANATTGRAFLQARQSYVKSLKELDPVDLKTMGQFVLLGDPSLRPFGAQLAPVATAGLSMSIFDAASPGGGGKGKTAKALSPAAHKARRSQLAAEGAKLENTKPRAVKASGAVPQPVRDSLSALAAKQGLEPGRVIRYVIERPAGAQSAGGAASVRAKGKGKAKGKAAANGGAAGEAIHVMFSRRKNGIAASGGAAAISGSPSRPKIPDVRALIAQTRDGKVVSFRRVASK